MSIKSRYGLTTVSPNLYGKINISGGTQQISTLTSAGTYSQGYIFVPYIMAQTSTIDDREWRITWLRRERKEKLKKLNW